jgi:protein-disulfide isomerase
VRLAPKLEQVLKKYSESVRIVFKNYPLKNHKFAAKAATAALAAGRQGKFWEFHDELFKNYRQLSDQKLNEIARKLDLKEAQFQEDRKDPEIVAKVQTDYQEGSKIGVRGIPAVFVNGRRISNRDLQTIGSIIEKEIKNTNKR